MNIKKSPLFLALFVIVLAITGFWGINYKISEDRKHQSLENIKVAYTADSIATQVLFDMAKDKDFYTDYRLNVEGVVNDKASHVLLTTGKADLSVSSVILPLNTFLNNENLLWVDSVFSNTPDIYLVVKDKKSDSIKFGVSKIGGITNIIASAIAPSLGWDKSKVEYVQAGDITTRFAYLETGKINATFLYPGEGLEQAKQNGYTVIEPKDLYGDVTVPVGVFTSQSTLDKRSAALKRFITAFTDFKKYVLNHQEETISFIKSKYSLSESEAEGVYQNMVRFNTYLKPETQQIETISAEIISIMKPENSKRSLTEFINTSLLK